MLERVRSAIYRWVTNFYTGPLPYTARAPWIPAYTRSDQTGYMRAVSNTGTLFGIVDGLSESVSMVDWCLYQKSASGIEEDRIQVANHKALDVWNNPNPHYSQDELIYAFNQHYDLVGEGWLHVVKAGGVPKQLWCVRPDRIAPVPHPETFIAGYEYISPDGDKKELDTDCVMRVKRPNPLDPYRGMGAVQAVLNSIDGLRFGNEWNARFFLNNATPGTVIEVPGELGDTEYKRFVARWGELHKGLRNAHRPAFLEGGMKVVPNAFSQRDMQFQELNILSREQIMEAYRYPKAMLGLVADSNRANSEAMEYMYSKWMIVPRLERMKKILNTSFLPMFGSFAGRMLEFDYHSPVPADEKTDSETNKLKAEAYKVLVDSGVNPEDAASAVGLPKMRIVTSAPKQEDKVVEREAQYNHRHVIHSVKDEDDKAREEWEKELDSLVKDWAVINEKQRDQIGDQVALIIDEQRITDLSNMKVDTDDASAVLLASLIAMATMGAKDIAEVAAQQGVDVQPIEPSESELQVLAATTVMLLGAGLTASAGREALRLFTPTSTGAEVATAVSGHLTGLSDAFLRDQLGGALWAADGAGRYSTLAVAPKADHYIANEVRDRNRCAPCKQIDGQKFYTLASAREAYPNGGFHACQGGVRCRGKYEPVWEH